MSYERLEESEPTNLVGILTSLIAFTVLLGIDGQVLQSAATAAGTSGTQALLTRQSVYSPQSIEKLRTGEVGAGTPLDLLDASRGRARDREPALAIGLVALAGSFLVQTFAGVEMTEAMLASAGIAGVQGVATRNRVYSPASARRTAKASLHAAEMAEAT